MSYWSAYYAAHKEERAETTKRFCKRHPHYHKEYYRAHTEQCIASSKKWYAAHRDEVCKRRTEQFRECRYLSPACRMLRDIRKAIGISQRDWALRYGIDQPAVSRYERGMIPIPASVREAYKEEIANALR